VNTPLARDCSLH